MTISYQHMQDYSLRKMDKLYKCIYKSNGTVNMSSEALDIHNLVLDTSLICLSYVHDML